MHKNRLWLLFIILIAFALRLTLLGEQSLWYDEGVTWFLSQGSSLSELIRWTAADIQPPLYYLVIWLTGRLFGQTEWALRFPSVVFNLLTLPVIYLLARRFFSPPPSAPVLARLAALLFALSPLMVYYSQEARMYTLLVLEATVSSYLLLRLLHGARTANSGAPGSTTRSLPLLYALAAATALYTHYFAGFLLIAHGLYLGFILWQRHWPRRLIGQIGQMLALVALLYIPWLPVLLARLGDDPSYWPGTLKLNEAVRKVFISFTVGETVFEQIGFWLALGYLTILLLAGLRLLVSRPTGRSARDSTNGGSPTLPAYRPSSLTWFQSLLFLLLWLLLPIVAILLLSYQSPKFNPRYTMLAWPAFLLLITMALASLVKPGPLTSRLQGRPYLPPVLFSLALLFILSSFSYSLFNWFTDPRFSKDDFQALAQFVRERIATDETVLLSSGHLFPVWAYYYGWENWTPLPDIPRLDVTRVTDLTIAVDIAQAVTGKQGVWLVSWQDEVIDPNGVIPFWLDLIGRRPQDAGDFYGVGLEHWRVDPHKLELLYQDPIHTPTDLNFANRVTLAGMTQLSATELALFWRPRQPLPNDLILTLDLTDQQGFAWDSGAVVEPPGSAFYPPARWPVGQLILTRHPLAWKTGTPPGRYVAEIGLGQAGSTFTGWDLLDEQGRPRRRTALLEAVELDQLIRPPDGPLPPAEAPVVDLRPGLSVRDSAVSEQVAEPGDNIKLALLWQAGESNRAELPVTLELLDSQEQIFQLASLPTPITGFSLSRWKPGDVVLGQYQLPIPAETAAGPARLLLHLRLDAGSTTDAPTFPIASLEILPTDRIFTLPASVDIPLEADFSGQITLLGASCTGPGEQTTPIGCHGMPGETVSLTFYWRADTPIAKNYTVFTHLLGPNDTPLVNADHAPPKPTQGWIPSEIVADTVAVTIPPDLPPGDYLLEVGLYDAADPDFPRLPLTTGKTRVILPQPFTVK